ncbi:solute carrier family 22 member 18 [Plakobranchus ocellatus]|uniref:Organic cation transporter-like protein 2 n=1 Tax=Plakobranchus ocellatus TaxID=259542 RepID=A0AAV4A051_9GAST|nr:solute carrier family 22 member 18 [Plakobranchus ocellatus]
MSNQQGKEKSYGHGVELTNRTVGTMPGYTTIHTGEKDLDKEGNNVQDENFEKNSISFFGRQFNRVVMVTHVNIFLYSCGFWVQQAVFPYLTRRLGADPLTFGYLQTTFAVVQLAGGPLFGRFGDLCGSRQAMTLAFASAGLSYFLLAIASSIPLLFLSRLPSIFMHAMQAGQMIVTDVCSSKNRADALGKLGISYGVGMVIGPMIGGFVSRFYSIEKAALVACILSLVSIAITYACVPSTVKKSAARQDTNIFSPAKIFRLLQARGAFFLLVVKMVTGVPMGIFQSMFAVVAVKEFQLAPYQNSYVMSYVGIMAMMVQGVGIGFVTKRFSEMSILTGSVISGMVGYLMIPFVSSIWHMCVVLIPLIVGLTFQNVVTTSALTRTVSQADTGAMLGLNMAVNSLVRSISPTIGGYMLSRFGFDSFGYVGFGACAVVTVVLLCKRSRTGLITRL